MVSEFEPVTEDLKTTILRPSLFIVKPSCQLLGENLLTPLAQGLLDLSSGVTLGDQVGSRLSYHVRQGQIVTSWIDHVEPIHCQSVVDLTSSQAYSTTVPNTF